MLSMLILLYLSHIVHLVLVENYCTQTSAPLYLSSELLAAYKMVFNGRHIGTPLQDKPHRLNMPQTPLSRPRFFVTRTTRLIAVIIVHVMVEPVFRYGYPGVLNPVSPMDLLPPKDTFLRRLSDVSRREICFRTALVLYQVWHSWALYTSVHDALGLVHVGLGLDEPCDWPPLFGKLSEAYTIRRFWGCFWHAIVRRTFTGYSQLVSRIVGVPRKGPVSRAWTVVFVFTLSGVVHGLATRRVGFKCGFLDDLWWFLLNAAAILGEELVIQGFQAVVGRKRSVPGVQWFGYLWVFGFMFWSLPKLYSAKLVCAPLHFFYP